MVGQIKFPDGRVAFMHDDGTWHSVDHVLEVELMLSYPAARIGPANMPWGECAVQLAADTLGAKAEFPRPIATIPKGAV